MPCSNTLHGAPGLPPCSNGENSICPPCSLLPQGLGLSPASHTLGGLVLTQISHFPGCWASRRAPEDSQGYVLSSIL